MNLKVVHYNMSLFAKIEMSFKVRGDAVVYLA